MTINKKELIITDLMDSRLYRGLLFHIKIGLRITLA